MCQVATSLRRLQQDAASTVKSVLPDEPKQAAQDAASAAKEAAPEAPKDIPNPFSGFFSGQASITTRSPVHFLEVGI